MNETGQCTHRKGMVWDSPRTLCCPICHMSDAAIHGNKRIDALQEENNSYEKRENAYIEQITKLKKELLGVVDLEERIQAAIEVYAGMEGFRPKTAPEGYLQRIINEMNNALTEKEDA